MNCSIGKIEREINANGVEYDRGSVFERFGQLTDIRKARGKRFSLETVLTIIGTCLAFEVVYGEVAKGNELVAGSNGRAEWANGSSPNCCSWMR